MKTNLLIIIGIILALIGSISILILIGSLEKQSSMVIDSRLFDAFNDGFVISSNFQIDEIFVDDTIQGISIKISPHGIDNDLALTDPLELLQKLYPENNVLDYVVLVNGIEIPVDKNGSKLLIHANGGDDLIEIVGFSKI